MEDLQKRVELLESSSMAPTTSSARQSQRKRYIDFCDSYDYDPLLNSPDQIVMYIAYLSFIVVFATISNYLSGVSHFLKSNGQKGIDYTNYKIKQALRGAKRLSLPGKGQARPLYPGELLLMFGCLNLLSLDDVAFWAAVTLGYRALLRVSNICGKTHAIRFKDISFADDVLSVNILTSKTNQHAENSFRILIVPNYQSVLCPFYWVKKLIRLSKPNQQDKLFRICQRGRWSSMKQSWFSRKFRAVTIQAGLGPGYSTHSLRRGAASHIWVWTTKFDTATWPFLKFDMRHGALVTRQEGGNQK